MGARFQIIQDNKRFLERRLRQYVELQKKSKEVLKVGLPDAGKVHKPPDRDGDKGSKKTSAEDVTLVEIGFANEFGTQDGRIPERSFLRSTIKEKRSKYRELGKKIAKRIIDKPDTFKKELRKLGLVVVGDVQNKIRTLKEPPNSPITIKLKNSDNPLVDSGDLGRNITFVIEKSDRSRK